MSASAVPPGESSRVVLASRSPRRRDLLGLLLPGRVDVLPPSDPDEEDLTRLTTRDALHAGITRVAAAKRAAVRDLLGPGDPRAVIAADTAVVVGEGDTGLTVLGNPPGEGWEATVRIWFREHYAGRTHRTVTAVAVSGPGGEAGDEAEAVVETRVTLAADADRFVDHLIRLHEPPGRAGGLAVLGLSGALLVERLDGSLSNVSGLPLRETMGLLEQVGFTI